MDLFTSTYAISGLISSARGTSHILYLSLLRYFRSKTPHLRSLALEVSDLGNKHLDSASYESGHFCSTQQSTEAPCPRVDPPLEDHGQSQMVEPRRCRFAVVATGPLRRHGACWPTRSEPHLHKNRGSYNCYSSPCPQSMLKSSHEPQWIQYEEMEE